MGYVALSPKGIVLLRSIASEFFATYIFIFAVTCFYINLTLFPFIGQAIIVGGLVTMFSALVVSAAFGAHFNPAITFAAMLLGIVTIPVAICYVIAQLSAALLASLTIMMVVGQGSSVLTAVVVRKGAGVTWYKSFNAEVMYTFIFVLVVYLVAWCAIEFPYALMIEYPKSDISLSPVLQNDENLINDLVIGEEVEEEEAMNQYNEYDEEYERNEARQEYAASPDYYTEEQAPLQPTPSIVPTRNPTLNEANFVIPAQVPETQTSYDRLARDRREVFVRDPSRLLDTVEEEGPMITATVRSLQTKTAYIPVAIGVTLSFLSMISGTTSGGAFNPARAFGPAVISGTCIGQWVYWIGDLLGAFLAVVVGYTLFSNKVFVPLSSSDIAPQLTPSPTFTHESIVGTPESAYEENV